MMIHAKKKTVVTDTVRQSLDFKKYFMLLYLSLIN